MRFSFDAIPKPLKSSSLLPGVLEAQPWSAAWVWWRLGLGLSSDGSFSAHPHSESREVVLHT